MARKSPNGREPAEQPMLGVLIWMDSRLASMDERLGRVEDRFERLEIHAVATTKVLVNLGSRSDNILTAELGRSVRDNSVRILRLEEDVVALRGKPHVG